MSHHVNRDPKPTGLPCTVPPALALVRCCCSEDFVMAIQELVQEELTGDALMSNGYTMGEQS